MLTPSTKLDAYVRNPDGSYNGHRLIIFLIYCTTGTEITMAEAIKLGEEAHRRAACRRK